MTDKRYRHGVCIVIRKCDSGEVLLCHRCGFPPDEGWQFPQGGIDRRRNLVDEVKRELREEIGTDSISVRHVSRKSYCYDLPESMHNNGRRYDGQCHRWVVAGWEDQDSNIRFSHEPVEFDAVKWVGPEEALARIVWFKRGTYQSALCDLGLLPACRKDSNNIRLQKT